jgi:hypothetical protein
MIVLAAGGSSGEASHDDGLQWNVGERNAIYDGACCCTLNLKRGKLENAMWDSCGKQKKNTIAFISIIMCHVCNMCRENCTDVNNLLHVSGVIFVAVAN